MIILDRGSRVERFLDHLITPQHPLIRGDLPTVMSCLDDILVCDGLLSASHDMQTCTKLIAAFTARFPIVVFFEPSIVSRDIFAAASLKSFHDGFDNGLGR